MPGLWLRWWQSDKKMLKDLTTMWNIFLLMENFRWTRERLKHRTFFLTSFILPFFLFIDWYHHFIKYKILMLYTWTFSGMANVALYRWSSGIAREEKNLKNGTILLKWTVYWTAFRRMLHIHLHFNQELIMVRKTFNHLFWL